MKKTIELLAAESLLYRAERACKNIALSLKELGHTLNVPFQEESYWTYLQNLSAALRKKYEQNNSSTLILSPTIAKLADDRIQQLMNKSLFGVVQDTALVAIELPNGKTRWDQYTEGLITESEYLNSIIDELASAEDIRG